MDREVNYAAEKNKWPIRLSGLELNIEPGSDNFDNAELIKALPVLFRIALGYANKTCSVEAVSNQTMNVPASLDEKLSRAARQFGMH